MRGLGTGTGRGDGIPRTTRFTRKRRFDARAAACLVCVGSRHRRVLWPFQMQKAVVGESRRVGKRTCNESVLVPTDSTVGIVVA